MYPCCWWIMFVSYACSYLCTCVWAYVLVEEDIKLNSQTMTWPSKMEPIFEVGQKKLATRREAAENQLKKRRTEFEETIAEFQTEVDSYREKELSRNAEDIRKTFAALNELNDKIDKARAESNVCISYTFTVVVQ